MPAATLVLINPHAGGGRAGRVWSELEPLMHQAFPTLKIAITTHPQQIPAHLLAAQQAGIEQVIAVGGDGTSHTVINALLEFQQTHSSAFVFGQLPMGTGQDFARILGLPHHPQEVVQWLAETPPQNIDVGQLTVDGKIHYFLNIASVGISGAVDQLVSQSKRYPWTFFQRTLEALLTFQPPQVQIQVDGESWYTGGIWLAAIANGTTFGRGMTIAPDARPNDGWFEVVVVKETTRLTVLRALLTVYSGTHIHRSDVLVRRGQEIEILAQEPVPLDLDGEVAMGRSLQFKMRPQALKMIWSGS